ncbi:MAG: hypothetical protein V4850_20860 [Myxococcota bacterium]
MTTFPRSMLRRPGLGSPVLHPLDRPVHFLVVLVGSAVFAGCDASQKAESQCDGERVGYSETGERFYSLGAAALSTEETAGTLHLCPGTHTGSLSIHAPEGASITIVGAGVADTILDGEGENRLLSLANGTFTVSGLTVQGGGLSPDTADDGDCCTPTAGAGLVVAADTTVLLQSVRFVDNEADNGAAILVNAGARVTLEDSTMESNSGERGGGVALRGPGSLLVSEASDWGVDSASDNRGGDVAFLDEDREAEDALGRASFEGVASFTCEWDTLVCE